MRSDLVAPARFALVAAASLLLARQASVAQPPTEETFLRDYAETRAFMLGRPVNATPTPDGVAVIFLRAKSAREPSQELYEFNIATGETRRLLAPEAALQGAAEQLSPEEKARRERQRISVGGFTSFSISQDSRLVLLSLSGKLYVLRRSDGGVHELRTAAGTIVDPKFSPDCRRVAYVRDQDIYVYDLSADTESAVTSGGTETISHGLAEFVAQEEMARYSGYWWSPDSRWIAFQESDASKVESWYPADPAQPGNAPARVFYPRPGKENVTVRVGVAPADASGETKWISYDRAQYPYLGKVTWEKNGPLTLTVLSRDQRDLALLSADTETGKTSVLLTEHDNAWVNLGQDVPVWLSAENGGGFLWASERTGWRNLERHDANGALQSELLPREDHFRSLAGVAGGRAIYTGEAASAFRLGAVPLDGKQAPLTPIELGSAGQVILGDSEAVFTVAKQSLQAMPRTFVHRVSDHSVAGELPSVALDPPGSLNAEMDRGSELINPRTISRRNRKCDAMIIRAA